MPVHLFILALKLVKSRRNILKTIKKAATDLLRSNLFATIFAMGIPTTYVCLRYVFPRLKNTLVGYFIVLASSFGFLFESRSRWGEMSIYEFAQYIEGFTYSLYKRKYLPVIPHWEKYVLMLAMGIISYVYFSPEPETDQATSRGKLDFIMRQLVGGRTIELK